jgi:hypothetical protein
MDMYGMCIDVYQIVKQCAHTIVEHTVVGVIPQHEQALE